MFTSAHDSTPLWYFVHRMERTGGMWKRIHGRFPMLCLDSVLQRLKNTLFLGLILQWKACVEQKLVLVVSPSPDYDMDVEALRRRLIQPSKGLVLRVAYCAWRRHFQGLQLLRAAHIHYQYEPSRPHTSQTQHTSQLSPLYYIYIAVI